MGSYVVSIKDLVEVMASGLDGVEGDFSDKHLKEALEIMKKYPYTSNSRRSEKKWRAWLNDITN